MTPVTRETLDALPVGSHVLPRPEFIQRLWTFDGDRWHTPDSMSRTSTQMASLGPFTVLLTPEQADAQTAEAVREARAEVLRAAALDLLSVTDDTPTRWLRARADHEEGRT